ANFCNFLLNRHWTFQGGKAALWREYLPFLAVGLGAQLVGFLLMTALMNPTSPICLPDSVFDDSSGLRTKSYWANLIVIVGVTPINFVLNKLWTFEGVRARHGRHGEG
ncbi:MAG: GtrA family protein, partial [Propionibacteriaceae bacterium]|nr:GtrA family protein [Propionibacteriaceae bacterium]